MTDVVSAFPITLNPNHSPSSSQGIDCLLGWSDVEQIMITFPPGCAGLVGARILYSGNQVYPATNGTWFILDDFNLIIPITNQQKGGQWRVSGYNSDTYPHVVTAYYFWNYLTPSQIAQRSSLISL